jgi:hypothetical protein
VEGELLDIPLRELVSCNIIKRGLDSPKGRDERRGITSMFGYTELDNRAREEVGTGRQTRRLWLLVDMERDCVRWRGRQPRLAYPEPVLIAHRRRCAYPSRRQRVNEGKGRRGAPRSQTVSVVSYGTASCDAPVSLLTVNACCTLESTVPRRDNWVAMAATKRRLPTSLLLPSLPLLPARTMENLGTYPPAHRTLRYD